MSIPYDLLEVIWSGETLGARPTSWNVDLTADDINLEEIEGVCVTIYELVCPDCGGMCSFATENIEIICDGCGSKTNNPLMENMDGIPDIPDDIDDDILNDALDVLPKKDKKITPEEILNDLETSITNTEILLDSNEKVEEKTKKPKTKKKTKKK